MVGIEELANGKLSSPCHRAPRSRGPLASLQHFAEGTLTDRLPPAAVQHIRDVLAQHGLKLHDDAAADQRLTDYAACTSRTSSPWPLISISLCLHGFRRKKAGQLADNGVGKWRPLRRSL